MGRTEKYLVRGYSSRPRAKYFPVRSDLTQSISVLSYNRCVLEFFWRSENAFMAAFASFRAYFSRRFVRVFPAPWLDAYGPHMGLFFHMVFQRNCVGGRTGHMINKKIVLLKSQSLDLGIRTVIIFKKMNRTLIERYFIFYFSRYYFLYRNLRQNLIAEVQNGAFNNLASIQEMYVTFTSKCSLVSHIILEECRTFVEVLPW